MADLLETRNLCDPEAGLCDPHIDQRLHLESVTPEQCPRLTAFNFGCVQRHDVEALPPEGVVAVTEVGVSGSVEHVDDPVEPEVAKFSGPS